MFIVRKEVKGRTKLPTNMCEYRGSPGKTACGCPCTMAFKSEYSLVGKIRAIFRDNGRSGDWNQILGSGNPAAAPLLKRHLQCISAEQASANMVSKQAVPLMFNKLAYLCRYLNYKGYTEKRASCKVSVYKRLRFFATLGHTGGLGGDPGLLTSSRLFNYQINPKLYFLR